VPLGAAVACRQLVVRGAVSRAAAAAAAACWAEPLFCAGHSW
jgi:hypothetical protein